MITTLAGSNDFMIQLELTNLVDKFKLKNDEISIEQIDGAEAEESAILESINSLSLLFPSKLTVLKRGSSNKGFSESVDRAIKEMPESNNLIIVEPNIDKRTSYYKNLKKLTDFKLFEDLDSNQLIKWIEQTAKQEGGLIRNNDARYLIEVAGSNQLKLSNEMAKLISFKPEISRENIDELVDPIPQTTIFQLLDAAFTGKSKEILRIYEEQKRQKVSPQQVIAMLTWQIHILAMIKAAGNASSSEIASKTKTNPYVVGKSMALARNMTMLDIRTLTEDLLELDVKLKNKTIDADDALLQLLLTIGK
jgi:DNA polymerase III delta subunit